MNSGGLDNNPIPGVGDEISPAGIETHGKKRVHHCHAGSCVSICGLEPEIVDAIKASGHAWNNQQDGFSCSAETF